MSQNIKNIKKSVSNTVSAITGTVAVSTEVVADASGLLANSIASTPAVLKALLSTPFAAAKGYLMEAEGLTEEQARAAAYVYLEQDFALTVEQAGTGAGRMVAKLFEELSDDDDTADTLEQRNQKEIDKVA